MLNVYIVELLVSINGGEFRTTNDSKSIVAEDSTVENETILLNEASFDEAVNYLRNNNISSSVFEKPGYFFKRKNSG